MRSSSRVAGSKNIRVCSSIRLNCLPLSVGTSSGTPNTRNAPAKARHTARPVLALVILAADVLVDRIRDRLVGPSHGLLIDHPCPDVVVAHPDHQILEPRAGFRRDHVPGVLEIVDVTTFRPYGPHGFPPGREHLASPYPITSRRTGSAPPPN
ncbi:hypothetical protein ABZT47_39540 [Sphaerisporangium sp. NPDC005289]|uniref:hypothetical protein n=1 Tax=Sphaerisporangium sp. NPDC005289 TaxID=3155247 RepID=UPI0033AD1BA7